MQQWSQEKLQQYIDSQIEENLQLDYKAAAALGKNDNKKKEITKDISAMANSVGGLVIYGISEYQDQDRKYLPEKLDPIDRNEFSKEWLEQVINTISPRLDGAVIHSVSIENGANNVVYVVEVPQSTTAHQARDHRYYKRFNFESVPMEDFEIRDVMGRSQHPKVEFNFEFEIITRQAISSKRVMHEQIDKNLIIRVKNTGQILALYVNGFIEFPACLLDRGELRYREVFEEGGRNYCRIYVENTIRDLLDVEFGFGRPINKYGPSRFDPILPGLSSNIGTIKLDDNFQKLIEDDLMVKWKVHADNALPNTSEVYVKDIEIVHRIDSEEV